MVVYADILVILNIAVDFLLISATSFILRFKPKLGRKILASVIGGFFSLYIFLPELNLFLNILFKLAVCILMSLSAFGFGSTKRFLKANLLLLTVTLGYGGIMTAIYSSFRPKGMAVINSVVYFNISPMLLLGFSVFFYLAFSVLLSIFSKHGAMSSECDITLRAGNKTANIKGILDTGNSLRDSFGNNEIIIADKCYAESLFGNCDINENPDLKPLYRAIPCATVSGNTLLDGFRCETAVINDGKKTVTLKSPILAISKTTIKDNYGAVVNPQIFG